MQNEGLVKATKNLFKIYFFNQTLILHLLYARLYSKHFTRLNSFNPLNNPISRYYPYSSFTEEEARYYLAKFTQSMQLGIG